MSEHATNPQEEFSPSEGEKSLQESILTDFSETETDSALPEVTDADVASAEIHLTEEAASETADPILANEELEPVRPEAVIEVEASESITSASALEVPEIAMETEPVQANELPLADTVYSDERSEDQNTSAADDISMVESHSEVFAMEAISSTEASHAVAAETSETDVPVEAVRSDEAQSQPELELIEVEESELEAMETVEAEAQPEDYSGLDKEQLVKLAEQLNRDPDPVLANKVIQKIRPLFDAIFLKEKQEALDKYIEGGGTADAFEFKHQQLEQRFNQAQKGIYEKRRLSQESQIKERAKNLEQKLGLLEQLRLLVDDHEHTPGYEKFKSIREEWKKIGPVGPEHAQNLNASYFSLIDRFHSLSEIYHNLRDFDRKKNLEIKLDIIVRMEKLAAEPLISKAMKELIILQEEYRATGPVPNDRFEEIKARLKAAADVLFERRRAFNEERKGQLQEELALKNALLEKISGFDQFSFSSAREWQEKTKELLVLQDEWKNSPGRFREKTAEVSRQFWAIYKKYMANKNEFFKTLDKGRKDLLSAKQALVEEVNSLKDGEDWDGITNRMKELQAEWKKISPVFSKEGQKVYDEFKAGIDHYFTRLRDRRSGEDKVQSENLAAKESLCGEIELLSESGKGDKSQVDLFREKFRNIGHVPSRQMQRINGRFSKALMTLIDASVEIPAGDKERMKIQILSSRSTYSAEGVKQLQNQESYIQKRLQQLRKDAGNLEDNVSMFRMSKNAMAMIEDVQKRINLYHMEIRELEAQLREIRSTEKAER